jgi:hypothetical protein
MFRVAYHFILEKGVTAIAPDMTEFIVFVLKYDPNKYPALRFGWSVTLQEEKEAWEESGYDMTWLPTPETSDSVEIRLRYIVRGMINNACFAAPFYLALYNEVIKKQRTVLQHNKTTLACLAKAKRGTQ